MLKINCAKRAEEIILNLDQIVSISPDLEGSNCVVIKMTDGSKYHPFTNMEEVEKSISDIKKIVNISNVFSE